MPSRTARRGIPGGLFGTLFLGMLALVAASIGVSAVLTVVMARQGLLVTGHEEILENAVAQQGVRCADLYERQGPRALQEALMALRRDIRLSLRLSLPDGTPLLPHPGDPRMWDRARDELARGRTYLRLPDRALAFRRIRSSSGREYLALGTVPVQGLLPPPGPSRTGALIHLGGLAATLVLACLLLARRLSRPLRDLSGVTERIAGGDLEARVHEGLRRRRDEIGDLARSVDAMAEHVTALLSSQRQLLLDVSHELRSPLARMGVALELARRRAGDRAGAELDRMEAEAERLNDLVGQVLSLARLDLDPLREPGDPRKVPLLPEDLEAIAAQVVRDGDFEARNRNRRVLLESGGRTVRPLNALLVHRALENVVRNALRHTEEGSEVRVRVASTEERGLPGCRVEVDDRGPGVPEDQREAIFDPFRRLGEARDRDSGGAGLGLAIARRVAELHGGWIRAENLSPRGLRVTLFFPDRETPPGKLQ